MGMQSRVGRHHIHNCTTVSAAEAGGVAAWEWGQVEKWNRFLFDFLALSITDASTPSRCPPAARNAAGLSGRGFDIHMIPNLGLRISD